MSRPRNMKNCKCCRNILLHRASNAKYCEHCANHHRLIRINHDNKIKKFQGGIKNGESRKQQKN